MVFSLPIRCKAAEIEPATDAAPEREETEEVLDEPVKEHAVAAASGSISEFSVSFRGTSASLPEFYNMLRYMIPEGREITLSVRCFVEENGWHF